MCGKYYKERQLSTVVCSEVKVVFTWLTAATLHYGLLSGGLYFSPSEPWLAPRDQRSGQN